MPVVENIRHAFIMANDPLAMHVIKRYWYYYRLYEQDIEDVKQVARLGLILATDRFKPELGYKFSTYASRVIQDQLKGAFVERKTLIRVPSYHFNAPTYPINPKDSKITYKEEAFRAGVCFTSQSDTALDSSVIDPPDAPVEQEDELAYMRKKIAKVKKFLPEPFYDALVLRHVGGLLYKEIAQKLRISKQGAALRVRTAVKMAQKVLSGEAYDSK